MWEVPLIRTPRTLPRVLAPSEAVALLAALRTARHQAMVQAMLLGGLRRCEVLGLRLRDVHLADKRLSIAEGKGGHERIVPVAGRFFITLAAYLERERPAEAAGPALFSGLLGQLRTGRQAAPSQSRTGTNNPWGTGNPWGAGPAVIVGLDHRHRERSGTSR